MDKRLMVELLPGPAFLIGNALGGIFLGAGLGALATALAILLRWRWDRSLPWLAVSIFGLTVILLALGLVLDDTVYVKLSNTVGSLAFAAIIAAGLFARPSLLERTLGHSIHMTARGWSALHGVWICLSLARAGANEIVWRTTSDQTWAIYNGVSDLAWIGLFVLATHLTAHRYWQDPA
jgi:intracellular septation protein